MGHYQYWREPCALCNETFAARDLTKVYLGAAHTSCPTPKKLCGVCDRCFPKLLDFLEVPEPEEKERKYTPPRTCRKCYYSVSQRARFCPYCGDELANQKKKE